MSVRLPEAFTLRMKTLLGAEYEAFAACYEKEAFRGLRLNPLKTDERTLEALVDFPLVKTPFSPLSYYAPADFKPALYAAHHAGAFYSQEPSAASAVTVLDPRPGERVLDLCAAPGGKSTQIASLLDGKGLLVANEFVRDRARVLLSNIERMGVRNAVVTAARPDVLCQKLEGFFDRVLVDAPCSGEGMFRRDPTAAALWTPETPASCAARQAAILDSAASAVRPGGVLTYSTCTFSPEENEKTVEAFLARHPAFIPESVSGSFGRPALDGAAVRVYPMDGGEGHFVARLRKTDGVPCRVKPFSFPKYAKTAEATAFAKSVFADGIPFDRLYAAGDTVCVLPDDLPALDGIDVLRAGVALLADLGKRFEPAHAAFLCRRPADLAVCLDLEPSDERLAAYLRGEEIACGDAVGYCGVAVKGVVAGFGKASSGRLKNKYPKGLRTR